MDESSKIHRVSFVNTLQLLIYLLTYSTLASGSLAGLLYVTGITHHLPIWAAIVLAPVFYLTWLAFFLAWGFLVGLPFYTWVHRCPTRMSTCGPGDQSARFATQMSLYLKCVMLQTLPMAQPLQMLPFWQQLVFRGYAPKNKIGRHANIWGILWDPDLTEIGDDTIIGAHTHICCHSVTVQPDGSQAYARDPVVIGRRVTVGGDCRINQGVTIGNDSILEPGSNVMPFTAIPAGEVWGGSPARFVRRRFAETASQLAAESPSNDRQALVAIETSDLSLAVCQLVANSLNVDEQSVSIDSRMSDIGEWDSLGQMGIAAAVHSRFGIVVGAAETFCLRSVADIVRFIERSRSPNTLAPNADESRPCPSESPSAVVSLPSDPELLPLWDHDLATQMLARCTDTLPNPTGNELRIVIAATFTAEAVASSLKLWARAFGLRISVEFAGFNQIVQELLSPGSLFHGNRTGLNVVLTRPEDLLADDRASSSETLLDAIATFSREANGTLVVATLPPAVSKLVQLDRKQVEELRTAWRQKLAELPEITQLDFARVVEEIGATAATQTDHEIIARSPYSADVYRELGILLARLVRQRRVAPAKVVAVDADGVLWGGVIAEDGLPGIHLGSDHPGRSFRLFQQYLRSLKANGQLLVLVSRNQPEDVWKVFDQHPEMVLRREDFAGARINWQPKSQNLKELARELNLGLDSFVFIDDDAANRLEMEANAPGVTVIPLPVDAAQYVPVISQLWRFDAPQLTTEDRSRTLMMQQETERQRLQQTSGDLKSYLQSLSLRVVMRPANEVDMPRVAQLTQKTNQFNLSLKRRSVSELRALSDRCQIQVIEASDRFGDYGLVGVCILERPNDVSAPFHLDTLLMSCRVLGRGVEGATLHGLAKLVRADGGQRLVAPLVIGPRNQPVAEFLAQSGFRSEDGSLYLLDVASGFPLPEHVELSESSVAKTAAMIPLDDRREENAAA